MVKIIPLSQGKHALVDDEDFEYLKLFSWSATNNQENFSYAINYHNGLMHRMICYVGKGIDFDNTMDIDHINGNTFDNRRCNLRVVTRRQNMQNRHIIRTSNYPGVCWDKNRRLWASNIYINNNVNHLGFFKTELEAFDVYKKAVHNLGEELVCEVDQSKLKRVEFELHNYDKLKLPVNLANLYKKSLSSSNEQSEDAV